MMKKTILMFMGILFISLVSAQPNFYVGESTNYEIKVSCENQGNFCSGSATCNITLVYPNSSLLVDNQAMTNLNNGYFNYPLIPSQTTPTGEFTGRTGCTDGNLSATTTFNYEVNPTGTELNTSKSILYVASLFFLIFFLVLTMFITGRLPQKKEYDEERELISVNQIAYLRPILYGAIYLEILALMFIISNVTGAYLGETLLSSLTFKIFYIMGKLLLPMVVIWFIYLIHEAVMHKTLQKELQRGIVGNG